MKKIIYFLLPSLFLMLGAGKAVKNLNTDEAGKESLSELKDTLEESKKLSDSEPEEDSDFETMEISLKETITVQGKRDLPIQKRVYKLNLPKNKEYTLLDQTDFTPTSAKVVSWKWERLFGEYYYIITSELNKKENYLLITTTPVWRDTTPGTSLTRFTMNQKDDVIWFDCETYGSETYVFHRPILSLED